MRIKVEHRTHYRFTEPQARVVQLLRLTPDDTLNQTVVSWRIDVDCDARLRTGVDGYGNQVRMLYAEGPLEAITIDVSGEVLLSEDPVPLPGTDELLPPTLYLRATPLTDADEALAAFADEAAGAGTDAARIDRLNAALHARFAIVRNRTGRARSAAEVFAGSEATPRGMAHMLIAAARAIGVPARYVAGYSLDGHAHRTHPAPHGWAELWIEGRGWLAYDPSTGGCPGLDHVRVAVALDAASAAPIAGTRIGHGEEALDVDLHVDRVGEA